MIKRKKKRTAKNNCGSFLFANTLYNERILLYNYNV